MKLVSFLEENSLAFKTKVDSSDELQLEFEVVAKPGAKIQKISVSAEGRLQVFVSARAVEGAANKAIIKYLSKSLGIPQGHIGFVSGEKSKQKRIAIYYSFSEHKNEQYFLEKWKSCLK